MSWRYAVDADIEKADDYSAASAREIDTKKVFLYPEWDYRKGAYMPDASRLGEFCCSSLISVCQLTDGLATTES